MTNADGLFEKILPSIGRSRETQNGTVKNKKEPFSQKICKNGSYDVENFTFA